MHRAWQSPEAQVKAVIRDRLVYPAAVALRHAGIGGVAGLWRRDLFKPFDPARQTV